MDWRIGDWFKQNFIVANEEEFREDLLSGEWFLISCDEIVFEEVYHYFEIKFLVLCFDPFDVVFWAKVIEDRVPNYKFKRGYINKFEEVELFGNSTSIIRCKPRDQNSTHRDAIDKLQKGFATYHQII